MGAEGGGHPEKWLPCPPVQGDPQNHTRGPVIASTIYHVSGKCGSALDVHDIGGRLSYPQRADTCGGAEHGSLLRIKWYHWVMGSVMASGGPQHTYWPFPLYWPDGQLRQF